MEERGETDRAEGANKTKEKPVAEGTPGKKTNTLEENSRKSTAPPEASDKPHGNKKEGRKPGTEDGKDRPRTKTAKPKKMSIRKGPRQESPEANKKITCGKKKYGTCTEKREEDSLKYGARLDNLNPYIK
jgi:hypothetical protein